MTTLNLKPNPFFITPSPFVAFFLLFLLTAFIRTIAALKPRSESGYRRLTGLTGP
jgi:hypothetical protein